MGGGESKEEIEEFNQFLSDISESKEVEPNQLLASMNRIIPIRPYRLYFSRKNLENVITKNIKNYEILLSTILNFFQHLDQDNYLSKGQLSFFSLLLSSGLNAIFQNSHNQDPKILARFEEIQKSFLTILSKLLFSPPLIPNDHEIWMKEDDEKYFDLRIDIMYAILLVQATIINDFPGNQFLSSLILQIEKYVTIQTEYQREFVRYMLSIFCALPYFNPDIANCIKEASPNELLKAFEPNYLLLNFSSLYEEFLTFFYLCCAYNSAFISEIIKSKNFKYLISILFNIMQKSLETTGVNYTHSIILSIFLMIFVNPETSSYLNEHYNQSSSFTYILHRGTLGDTLVELTSNLVSVPALQKSIVSIWQAITPFISDFSIIVVNKIGLFFESLYNELSVLFKKQKEGEEQEKGSKEERKKEEKEEEISNDRMTIILFLISRIMEIFAYGVQTPKQTNMNIKIVSIRLIGTFKSIAKMFPEIQEIQESQEIIFKFIHEFKNQIKKHFGASRNHQLSPNDAAKILSQFPQVFSEVKTFPVYPYIIGPNMKKNWGIWIHHMATRCQLP